MNFKSLSVPHSATGFVGEVGRLPAVTRSAAQFIALAMSMSAGSALAGMCVIAPPGTGNPGDLPRISISEFQYKGGFTIPPDQFGVSNSNFADAVIEQSGNSLYMVGYAIDDAIAEFEMPQLVNSTNIEDLNSTGGPVQQYTQVLNRASGGNPQSVDQIMGMEVYEGRLIINGDEYYDAPGDNTQTTLVMSDASNLAGSTVEGYFELPGGARSGGWITKVPPEWQSALNGDLLVGNSAGTAIISRHSVGPSAHTLNGNVFLSASINSPQIATQRLLEYSLQNPLNGDSNDLYNESRTNDIWTITTAAKFGFVVPGTSTYATFGHSSGHVSGLGYKITQDDGNLCGGPCSYAAADIYNYYWLYDMNDLLAVQAGTKNRYDVRPYSYGEFEVPFQTRGFNPIGGGSFDSDTNTLYLSVRLANNTEGQYNNPPVIAAFGVDVN